jgi:hypothetical protein
MGSRNGTEQAVRNATTASSDSERVGLHPLVGSARGSDGALRTLSSGKPARARTVRHATWSSPVSYGDSSPAAASRASMARAPESELGIE